MYFEEVLCKKFFYLKAKLVRSSELVFSTLRVRIYHVKASGCFCKVTCDSSRRNISCNGWSIFVGSGRSREKSTVKGPGKKCQVTVKYD